MLPKARKAIQRGKATKARVKACNIKDAKFSQGGCMGNKGDYIQCILMANMIIKKGWYTTLTSFDHFSFVLRALSYSNLGDVPYRKCIPLLFIVPLKP